MVKACYKSRILILSGIDGSGKTTIIDNLHDILTNDGYRTKYIWLRFNHYLTKIMHALARILKLSIRDNTHGAIHWRHEFYRSNFFCDIYILATYFDTLISRIKLNMVSFNCDYVICDRWIPDIIIDLAVKTRREDFIDSKWGKRFLGIMPTRCSCYVIYRDKADLLDCRQENRKDPNFELRYKLYKELEIADFETPIDNRDSIENSTNRILKTLYEYE